ncbi:MAG: GNAT family N-acetyltransferase [Xanthomonadales bacterium]|nr:GNAT family N-acetyltransferase [Xanthomonadales bacterium]
MVRVGPLRQEEIAPAAELLAASMRDNPLHRRVFGADESRLQGLLAAAFIALLRLRMRDGRVLAAHRRECLVGVLAMAPPGRCRPEAGFHLHMLALLARHRALARLPRILRWLAAWRRMEPAIRHWHLGPAAVERACQGQGIGTALMAAACAELDRMGDAGYLETDKDANVRLYRRGGFEVIAAQEVLGVRNWFMLRPPRPAD